MLEAAGAHRLRGLTSTACLSKQTKHQLAVYAEALANGIGVVPR